MAKEFAFLFYINDWAGGTQWMTRLQRGGYLDLLLYQVNNTSFSLEEVKLILGSDFDNIWPMVSSKFTVEQGLFFNEKMRNVLLERVKFTESRRANRLGKTKKPTTKKLKKNTSKTLVELVEREKEEEIEDVIKSLLDEQMQEIVNSFTLEADYMKNHKYTKEVYLEMLDDFHRNCREKEWDGSLRDLKLYLSNFNRTWKLNKKKDVTGTNKTEQRQTEQAERDRQSELARHILNGTFNPEGQAS